MVEAFWPWENPNQVSNGGERPLLAWLVYATTCLFKKSVGLQALVCSPGLHGSYMLNRKKTRISLSIIPATILL
jgi:hypothetical protein